MQQVFWLLLAFAAADDPKVLEVGKGLSIKGTLDKAKPEQVYHVKLHKGGTYVIDMISPNPKALDPFLRLLDAAGKTVAADDESGSGLSARILFLAPATGTYQIVATSASAAGMWRAPPPAKFGPFTLAVKRDDSRKADALKVRVQPYQLLLSGNVARKVMQLEQQVDKLQKAGKFTEAVLPAYLITELREKFQGADHWQTVDSRRTLQLCQKLAQRSEGERADYTHSVQLHAQALISNLNGRYPESEALARKALAIRQKVLGEDDPDTAETYNLVALSLKGRAKFAEAVPICHKALAISRKSLGEDNPVTALCYSTLGGNLHGDLKYVETDAAFRKAVAICQKTLGELHPNTAAAYSNLAFSLNAAGKFGHSEAIYRKALKICEKVVGDEHPLTAGGYNNLAFALNGQGKNAEADPLYRKAVAIRRKVLGDEHPLTALTYNNLAINLDDQGKFSEAEPLFRKALAIVLKAHGEQHPETVKAYGNLAFNLDLQAKHAAAGELYKKALLISEKVPGPNHPETAGLCDSAAGNLKDQGRYAEAELLCRRSVAIHEKVLGRKVADTAVSYTNLAGYLQEQGKFGEADTLYRKALSVFSEAMGEGHLYTAGTYNNIAVNLHAQGKYADAETFWSRGARGFAVARLRNSATGLQRTAFTAKYSSFLSLAACRARLGKPAAAWQSLEAALARGLLDDLSAQQSLSLTPNEQEVQQDLNATLIALDKRIDNLLAGRRQEQAAAGLLEELIAQRKKAQFALSDLEASLADRQVFTMKRIQSRIPADAAVIAWVDLKPERKAKDPAGEHWACVLRQSGPPAWIKLPGGGPKGEWTKDDDELPSRFRKALAEPADLKIKILKEKLSAQRMAPLVSSLGPRDGLPAVRRLMVVPVGLMAGVPVEAISDAYVVSYIPSGSIWARLQEQGRLTIEPTLLAVGDPAFRRPEKEVVVADPPPKHGVLIMKVLPASPAAKNGLQAGDVLLDYEGVKLESPINLSAAIQAQMKKAAATVAVTIWRAGKTFPVKLPAGPLGVQVYKQPAGEVILAQREADRLIRASRGADFTPLPGSRAEVEAIAKLLPKDATLKLLGSQASEQKLADLADRGELKKYRYLHFATHGEVNSHIAFQSAIILAQDQLPEPADALRGKNFIDGRLTAAELLNWKLDADMVVLSACQTGLGQPAGGEGYLGFSQALFKAGARSLVVSLWKVDDTATSLLMVRFYENLLGRRPGLKAPMPKAEALSEAKRWLRNLTAKEAETLAKNLPPVERIGTAKGRPLATTARPYEHPYYWAAFILIGDPR